MHAKVGVDLVCAAYTYTCVYNYVYIYIYTHTAKGLGYFGHILVTSVAFLLCA